MDEETTARFKGYAQLEKSFAEIHLPDDSLALKVVTPLSQQPL